MTIRIENALTSTAIKTPCLIIDCKQVRRNYKKFCQAMKNVDVFYAVKANPHPDILTLLADAGSFFDCASFHEISLVLEAGGKPEKIYFGSTLKKVFDIKEAYNAGIRHFTFDAKEELLKLARYAPNARVSCRILANQDGTGAQWPLSRKFGCDDDMAVALMSEAAALGLLPAGISFHVGSQQIDVSAWNAPIKQVNGIFKRLARNGIILDEINLGGGFPTDFGSSKVPGIASYVRGIKRELRECFGPVLPRLIVEPGRALVGDAGIIVSEVVLVSKKSANNPERWVYLDVGRFHGLAETEGEAIRYRISVPRRSRSFYAPAIIAGPTCDSVDTLYEQNPVEMPIDLAAGDVVLVHDTGAYTATYSSIGFNGFAPLKVCLVEQINDDEQTVLTAN